LPLIDQREVVWQQETLQFTVKQIGQCRPGQQDRKEIQQADKEISRF
jgi:hypothetical protein